MTNDHSRAFQTVHGTRVQVYVCRNVKATLTVMREHFRARTESARIYALSLERAPAPKSPPGRRRTTTRISTCATKLLIKRARERVALVVC